jgi:hypothetical protein
MQAGIGDGLGCYGSSVPRDRVLRCLLEALPNLRATFGVRELSVFGSTARGEARADSDVDVLVDFDGPATFDRFVDLKLALQELLGVRVDLVTRGALRGRLATRIPAEAVRVA